MMEQSVQFFTGKYKTKGKKEQEIHNDLMFVCEFAENVRYSLRKLHSFGAKHEIDNFSISIELNVCDNKKSEDVHNIQKTKK